MKQNEYITKKQKPKKWLTERYWVDTETGEALTKNKVKREYVVIRKTKEIIHKKIKNNGNNYETIGIVVWYYECTKTGKQTSIWND